MNHSQSAKTPRHLYAPKHWGSWLVVGILWVLVRLLPYSWLMRLGSGLGLLMSKVMPYRSLIAQTNIRLCFENSPKDWQAIYKEHIKSVGKGLFEMAMGWFLPKETLQDKVLHIGYEHVDNALKKKGRGVLFLGIHSTGLDFGLPLLNTKYPTALMYKAQKNPVFDWVILRSRLRNCPDAIENGNMRGIIAKLRRGECFWYGCDQDFGHRTKSVFAPFFGVQAFTLPYYAKIAQKTHAAVIPIAIFRDDKNARYVIKYLPEIDITQSLSDKQAALALNQNVEKLIAGYEDQYYWIHRRFKTRPEGETSPYPEKPRRTRR